MLFQRLQPSYVFVAKLQQIDSRLPIDESSTLSDVVAYILALGDIINLVVPDMEPNYMAKLAKVHKEVSKAVPQHNENVRNIFHDIHKVFASADQPFTEDTATEILEIFDKFRAEVVKMVGMKSDEERPVSEEAGLDEKDQLQMYPPSPSSPCHGYNLRCFLLGLLTDLISKSFRKHSPPPTLFSRFTGVETLKR